MEKIIGRESFWGQIVRGVVTALITTLISVLVFAFILSVTNLGDGVIKPINQIIKLISPYQRIWADGVKITVMAFYPLFIGRNIGILKGNCLIIGYSLVNTVNEIECVFAFVLNSVIDINASLQL